MPDLETALFDKLQALKESVDSNASVKVLALIACTEVVVLALINIGNAIREGHVGV